jgi:hypothetical protein
MKVGFEERLPCRLGASALGFDGNEHRIDLGKRIGIVGLQHPAPIALAVHVEDRRLLYGQGESARDSKAGLGCLLFAIASRKRFA